MIRLRWGLAALGTVLVALVGLFAFTAFRGSSTDEGVVDFGATDAPHLAAAHALVHGLPAVGNAVIDPYQTACWIATSLCETSASLSPDALIGSVRTQLVALGAKAESLHCDAAPQKTPDTATDMAGGFGKGSCQVTLNYHGSLLRLTSGSPVSPNPAASWLRIQTSSPYAEAAASKPLPGWDTVSPLPKAWAIKPMCTDPVAGGCEGYRPTPAPVLKVPAATVCAASQRALVAHGYLLVFVRRLAATPTWGAGCMLQASKFRSLGGRDGTSFSLTVRGVGAQRSKIGLMVTVSPWPAGPSNMFQPVPATPPARP